MQHHQEIKQRWVCRQCLKCLSSKRSFDEHMNIHNKARPFGCDECDYAAASQMTLRRHKLRNHVPRTDWGYQCPYCGELYMEPASYQQHIIARHWGHSATFGCPYGDCTFTTKSSRFFREHLSKHQAVMTSRAANGYSSTVASCKLNLNNIASYLINDECGAGNSNSLKKKKIFNITTYDTIPRQRVQFQQSRPAKTAMNLYKNAIVRVIDHGDRKVTRINVEKLLEDEEERHQQENNRRKRMHRTQRPMITGLQQNLLSINMDVGLPQSSRSDYPVIEVPFVPLIEQSDTLQSAIDWIEAEVVIDDEAVDGLSQLPDGQIDDFGLD